MRNLLIGSLFLISILAPSTCFATEESTEILVCSEDRVTCEPKSCLEQCLKESEEPLDCPAACTIEA